LEELEENGKSRCLTICTGKIVQKGAIKIKFDNLDENANDCQDI